MWKQVYVDPWSCRKLNLFIVIVSSLSWAPDWYRICWIWSAFERYQCCLNVTKDQRFLEQCLDNFLFIGNSVVRARGLCLHMGCWNFQQGTVLAPFEWLFSDDVALSLDGSLATIYTPFKMVRWIRLGCSHAFFNVPHVAPVKCHYVIYKVMA
jgi:hypothetical protein